MNRRHMPVRKPPKRHTGAKGYQRYTPRSYSFVQPKPKRRNSLLASLLVLGALVLAVVMITRMWDYRQAEQEYAVYAAIQSSESENMQAEMMAMPSPTQYVAPASTEYPQQQSEAAILSITAPKPTAQPYYSEQVAKLKKQNSDAVAWIEIPDTDVQYPVAQGKDNEYYQTHTFAKKKRATGSIFLDAWNSKSFADFNTVIYGHHMKDGSMFTVLLEYHRDSFLRNHKYINVTLENSKKTYKVFAAYECDESVDFRGFRVSTDRDRINFLKRIVHDSVFTTNAEATPQDRILTLATCTGGERNRYWIVHAVLVEDVTVRQ